MGTNQLLIPEKGAYWLLISGCWLLVSVAELRRVLYQKPAASCQWPEARIKDFSNEFK